MGVALRCVLLVYFCWNACVVLPSRASRLPACCLLSRLLIRASEPRSQFPILLLLVYISGRPYPYGRLGPGAAALDRSQARA